MLFSHRDNAQTPYLRRRTRCTFERCIFVTFEVSHACSVYRASCRNCVTGMGRHFRLTRSKEDCPKQERGRWAPSCLGDPTLQPAYRAIGYSYTHRIYVFRYHRVSLSTPPPPPKWSLSGRFLSEVRPIGRFFGSVILAKSELTAINRP